MGKHDYRVRMKSGEDWTMRMDASEAGFDILHIDEDGDSHSTPFETAHASHDTVLAAEMIVKWWNGKSGDTDEVIGVD